MKEAILVRVETDSTAGWGECVASIDPAFSEEFNDGVWLVTENFLAPTLAMVRDLEDPADVATALAGFRGNRMAKSALEAAFLDAWLRERDLSMREWLGATRDHVPVGVSVGIPDGGAAAMVEQVAEYLEVGYQRIKLKIAPGFDVEPVSAVRSTWPDIMLSVDANAAYGPDDLAVFEQLDRLDLLMIEQPFSHEDIVQHAWLQERLDTALCLDESIRSAADAAAALQLGACRIINIKPGRVGGYLEGRRIHDLCVDAGVPVWHGGMLEMGVGRAMNLALAALPGFTIPGDISASERYFTQDITTPFEVAPDGTMAVPTGPGIGVDPDMEIVDGRTMRMGRFEY